MSARRTTAKPGQQPHRFLAAITPALAGLATLLNRGDGAVAKQAAELPAADADANQVLDLPLEFERGAVARFRPVNVL